MSEVPVFYDHFQIASILVDETGGLTLRYDPRWQGAHGAFPVSLTMPLSRAEHPTEVVHPWIANLLPEEMQLTALAQRLGVAQGDSLAILQEIGGDTAGALSFGAPSLRKEWSWIPITEQYDTPDPSTALARHFEDLRARPFLIGEDGVRLSLAGGQQKSALAVLGPDGKPKLGLPMAEDVIAIPKNGAPSTLILKPDNPRLEGIVENEAYCLALAKAVGITSAEAGIITAEDRSALMVGRYDRTLTRTGQIRRLHQEDLAQALSIFPGRKYERGTLRGPTIKDLLTVGTTSWQKRVQSDATLLATERQRLIDQFIFNVLVANTDAHAKNYSLLLGDEIQVAPLYDVSTVLLWSHVNQYLAQNVGGRKRKPGDIALRHWQAIAADVGLNARQMRRRVTEMIDRIVTHGPNVSRQISQHPGASVTYVQHVQGAIESNALRILGRLTDATID